MNNQLEELNRRFGIPGRAAIVEGGGGLAKVQVMSPTASGEIYLHGAHVTSWRPRQADEVFFVSEGTRWRSGTAIRGGVPICFPWFGPKDDDSTAPAHGFVRTKAWEMDAIEAGDESVTVTMATGSGDDTRSWWPADFRLVHRVTFGETLHMELTAVNTGRQPLRFQAALHSYHRVGDIGQVHVSGLDRHVYRDKTDPRNDKTQRGSIGFTAETDRIYLNATGAIEIEDPLLQRRTRITKEASRTTVVWNPWAERARALADLGDDEWRQFVCVEPSNVGESAVELAPGAEYAMTVVIAVSDPDH